MGALVDVHVLRAAAVTNLKKLKHLPRSPPKSSSLCSLSGSLSPSSSASSAQVSRRAEHVPLMGHTNSPEDGSTIFSLRQEGQHSNNAAHDQGMSMSIDVPA